VRVWLDLATEREPSLLVVGPDRALVSWRLDRKAPDAMRRQATCLVWA
jgi:hypothetical protein